MRVEDGFPMSEALYRKYRPQIFEDVVGQEHIERTIKNAIGQDKVSHAYLFTGPRGTGKTTTARLLAKALLCEKGPTAEPDGTCDDCVAIANGEHPDVYELDAASRTGVENVREEIIGRVQFAPTRGRYKVYIVDEVHMLSTAAFNALLKTLEEPPSHVVFILCTTDPQKVPETIHSRCQRFDFRRISAEAIVSRLGAVCVAEGVEFEGEALDLIAHRAEGGMRNALTSLEQLIAFGEGKVTMEVAERLLGSLDSSDLAAIVRAIGTRDVASCFRWTAEYVETGADLAQFVRDLAEHIRNMYVLALAGDDVALEVGESVRRELADELPLFGPDRLARMLGVLGDVSAELKTSTNPRLSFEIALTRMVRPDSDLTLESLAERVEALEAGHSAVAHVVSAAAPSGVSGQAAVSGFAAQAAGATGGRAASVAGASATEGATHPAGGFAEGAAASAGAAAGGVEPAAQAAASLAGASSLSGAHEASAAGLAAAVVGGAAVAPAPASEAPAPATGNAPSGSLLDNLQNPAALQRVWQAALTTLKKSKAAYGVLFLNTKAAFDAARATLVVEFPAENTFAFKAVQKPDVQDALAEALRQACGEQLAFVFAQAGSASSAGSAAGAGCTAASDGAAQALGSVRPAAEARAAIQQQPPRDDRQPQAAVQSAAASQVGSAAEPASRPSPRAGFEPPAPEPTPVDLYDEMPPYDDEPFAYDDYAPAAATRPASSAPSGTANALSPDTPAASGAVASAPPSSAALATGEGAPSSADLEAILATSFGDGVVIEEVRE